MFAARPAVSSRCEQCHVVSWRRKLNMDCCIVFAGVRAGSAKVDCCLIRLHRCTYVLLDCSALLLYRNVRRIFVMGDNAPLPPEAQKIVKIRLRIKVRNGASCPYSGTSAGFWLGGTMPPCCLRRRKFWKFDYEMVHSEVYLNKSVVSIAPFSTPACPHCSQNIT